MKLKEIRWWLWILLLAGGLLLFFVLYMLLVALCMKADTLVLRLLAVAFASAVFLGSYWFLVSKIEKREVKELSLKMIAPQMMTGVCVGLSIMLLSVGVPAIAGCYSVDAVVFDIKHILMSLLLYFVVALGEEVLFRGLVFRYIDSRWNFMAALIVSVLIFGFFHSMNAQATIWSSIAIAVEAGALLGAAYKFSGSLYLPIGIHWAWNFAEDTIVGSPVSGVPSDWSVFVSNFNGPDFLTGGGFGMEASLISFIIALFSSMYYIIWVHRTRLLEMDM